MPTAHRGAEPLPDALAPAWTALRCVPPLVLLWLAFFFGRTLRHGQVPLIERIARCSSPALSAPLCRYTRRLTAVWCVYFALASTAAAAALWLQLLSAGRVQLAIGSGTALLFVGERLLRPMFHPGEAFPGLVQQLRDTVSVWRVPGRGR